MISDTITAIATALSESGIGIVRISGEESLEIADKIFRTKSGKQVLLNVNSHTVHHGYIVDKDVSDSGNMWKSSIIDEVMAVVMKAPRSYTMEDTVEINCHGGILVIQKILETVINSGARLAEPGEFTKRAFLNGRIDLSEAEAVIDIIHSKNEFALKSSVNQLKGSVSATVKKMREDIIYEIAFIESALDDPEHISLEGYSEKLLSKLNSIIDQVEKLVDSADNGRIIKEGINTVIVGKPNVGKSSLLNIMIGEERAIVTDIAGTTRDILQEIINLKGISLNIIDTAGIRNTDDIVEKIGVEKAIKFARNADLILYMADTSTELDENDKNIISFIGQKNTIILMNKSDLDSVVELRDLIKLISDVTGEELIIQELTNDNSVIMIKDKEIRIVRTSLKENKGIDLLENIIMDMFFHGKIKINDEVVITNIRHKSLLQDVMNSLLLVKKSLNENMPEDFLSIDLMSAYYSLGLIIGEEIADDLANEIFSKFCMGK